ncbi:hypothetical protein HPB47_025610 [Ixodes persulcatus]|uniref:Uncharacterized protein n=1 Tax=Ixodes persulcatus TaxID=34615 RepID=A0AC60Q127_IXOPE|nr:hypothetical protein HPB47_025610 [Ixodes persulcatus]
MIGRFSSTAFQLTALEWMSRLEPSSTPVCLSFNMAAVEFRGLAYPSAGSRCETSREIAPPCAGYGWQSGRDSNASLTAHAYRDDVWISQETGALLREKLLMASRRLPKLCVALFNVDMDSPAFRCRGAGDEAFPRVSELARSARYAERGLRKTENDVASTSAARPLSSRECDLPLDWGALGRPARLLAGALVCVLSPAATHLDRFPAHLCSYLVFTRRLDAEQATPPDVLPLPGSRYASFLKLCARTRTPAVVATVPSALSPIFAGGALSEAPAHRLSVALLKAGLDGMAVFAAPDENLALLDQYLEGMSSYYRRRASPLRLLAGVYYREFDPAILKRLVSESTMTLSDAKWVTSYRRNSSWIQIFEDEDTIAKKMTSYLNDVPDGCAAAINADLEDSRGKCPGRRAYSRLKSLAGLLEKSPEVLSHFPSDACDYVVLSRHKFRSVENISSILDVWQSLLPAQRPTTPLAVEVNSHTLVSTYTNDVKAGALLIESVPGWLERNDVQGVAVLIGGLSARQELLMYSILKTSSLLRTKELMSKGSGKKTFCVTLNLAVLKYKASPERLSLGAQCGAESLAGYSEVCSLPSSRTVFDMNWMSASLRSGDVLYTFEKEGVLLSKVLFLKTLHPSLCVAAFHTELDSTSCTQPFARLVEIRAALELCEDQRWGARLNVSSVVSGDPGDLSTRSPPPPSASLIRPVMPPAPSPDDVDARGAPRLQSLQSLFLDALEAASLGEDNARLRREQRQQAELQRGSIACLQAEVRSLRDVLGIRDIIREVVREEIRKMLPALDRPSSISLAEVVREEVHRAFQPEVPINTTSPEEPTLSYAAMARRPPQVNRQATAPPRRDPPTPQYPRRQGGQVQDVRPERPSPRKTDVWRTADRRPLCYDCGEADHIYRGCSYRRPGLRGFRPNDPRPSVETRKKVAEGSILNSPSGARETSNGRWYNRWPEERCEVRLYYNLVPLIPVFCLQLWECLLPVSCLWLWITRQQRGDLTRFGPRT